MLTFLLIVPSAVLHLTIHIGVWVPILGICTLKCSFCTLVQNQVPYLRHTNVKSGSTGPDPHSCELILVSVELFQSTLAEDLALFIRYEL